MSNAEPGHAKRWAKGQEPYLRRPTGKKIFLMSPTPSQWDIPDIAWHLAGLNRYTGGSRFSVAQHCVVASRMAAEHYPDNALLPARMLIHDVAEAVYGDMSAPLKALCPEYVRLIDLADATVEKRFDLTFLDDPLVKEVDLRMWLTERLIIHWEVEEDLSEDTAWSGLEPFPLPDENFEAWSPEEAESEWLLSCRRLIPWAWK
jgi:hypothetical protein